MMLHSSKDATLPCPNAMCMLILSLAQPPDMILHCQSLAPSKACGARVDSSTHVVLACAMYGRCLGLPGCLSTSLTAHTHWFQKQALGRRHVFEGEEAQKSSHWPNTHHGRLLKLQLLTRVRAGELFGQGCFTSLAARMWHRHLLEVVETFTLNMQEVFLIQEPQYVYTQVLPDGSTAELPDRHSLYFLPGDVDLNSIRLRPAQDGLGHAEGAWQSFQDVVGSNIAVSTVMVPDPIMDMVSHGSWQCLVLLGRSLPGAQNKRRHLRARYCPCLPNFPDIGWLAPQLQLLSTPVTASTVPITAERVHAIAENISRWTPMLQA